MAPATISSLRLPEPSRVRLHDTFWSRRQEVNHRVTLPTIYRRCKETGRLAAWKLTWRPGMPGKPHMFWDSDVAKWLEAACYSLQLFPDERMLRRVEALVQRIVRAQQPDGYLNTYFTSVSPQLRWKNLRDGHELYCAGHLIEAAIAHSQLTGRSTLLDAVCRYADHIESVFGTQPGKRRGYPGHPEIELALVKLFHVTGERRHLELARYFVEERGRQPHYFDLEARERGEDPADYWDGSHAYTQSHQPVREQERVVGHAVRALYLYSAMADLAVELQDDSLLQACERLWRHLKTTQLYVTGGVGSRAEIEGFSDDYDLPNETAYAETCAAIGLVFWAQRMAAVTRRSEFVDVLERALYNNVLASVSLDGERFFYRNPLASRGSHHRQTWFQCACCPPNLARVLASIQRYFYAYDDRHIFVNLYASNEAELPLASGEVRLVMVSAMPWSGRTEVQLFPRSPASFSLAFRIPEWTERPEVAVNDQTLDAAADLRDGYLVLTRQWQAGDRVVLHFPMPVRRMEAHPRVSSNCGRVALQRGPFVYCFEEADNGPVLGDLHLPASAAVHAVFSPQLLDGVMVLRASGRRRPESKWNGLLYRPAPTERVDTELCAVPYFAWDNRRPGEMLVWIRGD